MISDLLTMNVLVGILASGIRLATPYLYATIGEAFGQRSGVLNLGLDGQMLLGALAAFYVAFNTGNLWLGLLAAVIVGDGVLAGGKIPQAEGVVLAAAGEDFVARRPRDIANPRGVTFERLDRLPRGDIPDDDLLVDAAAGHPRAVA